MTARHAHPASEGEPHGPWEDEAHHDEEMPRIHVTRRSLVLGFVSVAGIIAVLYFVLPTLGDVEDGLSRVQDGNPWWLALAVAFSVLSFVGYVATFKGVYVPAGDRAARRIGFSESYQITMASLAATRLFAAGGAGGVALTAWALRRAGMPPRMVADRTIAFLVLTYAIYMLALIVAGFGLRLEIFEGSAPFGITVVPAVVGAAALAVALGLTFLPADLEGRFERWATGHGRLARIAARLSTAPAAVGSGVRAALGHVRRRDPALAGAAAYWGFNIAILWACFHAFGEPPPPAVVVMAYYVGLLGNLLPLPGGVGGVDGGMIGALAAFGVELRLATVAVLSYRIIAFWLPTIPGAIAYLQLRRTVHRWRAERANERTGSFQAVKA
jgi:uncharacterized membrane protein YbhN (UPF0104 family)